VCTHGVKNSHEENFRVCQGLAKTLGSDNRISSIGVISACEAETREG
jgi:hypothetical protein